ncbi:MAG: ABC-F family ATP-binding cassette domain-containing protein [Candidatus Binatia bacterium]|nr:ABC-F family ATP-binding cassette domain-containing protein [Candidatus Binatia bacterium]
MSADPKPIIDGARLRKSYGDRTVLADVSLTLHAGERVGLVGNNGSGKSTLGRILAGVETLEGGAIALRRGAVVDYLGQEPNLPAGETVRHVVLHSLDAWSGAKKRYEEATAGLAEGTGDVNALVVTQAAAGDELERLGGWERLHEAEAIIGHLGIRDPGRSVDSLSGGERRRVDLARVLVGDPDLAILDEPTNHLDVATIEWLEEHLVNEFKGALLLITHDRYVLDRVTTRTFELHRGSVMSYAGGYATYLEAKAEREAQEERTERNRQNFLRTELEWLRRRPKARSTKQKARVDRAEAARDQKKPEKERVAALRSGMSRLGKTILTLEGLSLERDGRRLIDKLDLRLGQGDRVGIVGPNGSGKTSLLLCLLDQLTPTAGVKTLGENTKPGYLDQMRGQLDETRSIRESVAEDQNEISIGDERLDVASYLERFLFDRPAQRHQIATLSGGERARVCLARLLCQNANLLLLDEPTNDLDVATLGALESMLTEYSGCALVVSHDRWFLDRVATSILAFEGDGRVVLHAGGYTEYRERVAREEAARAKTQTKPVVAKVPPREKTTAPKKLTFAEKRELDGLLEKIDVAEGLVRSLEEQLADPATYRDRGDAVAVLRADLESAGASVAELTARWEELEEKQAAFES